MCMPLLRVPAAGGAPGASCARSAAATGAVAGSTGSAAPPGPPGAPGGFTLVLVVGSTMASCFEKGASDGSVTPVAAAAPALASGAARGASLGICGWEWLRFMSAEGSGTEKRGESRASCCAVVDARSSEVRASLLLGVPAARRPKMLPPSESRPGCRLSRLSADLRPAAGPLLPVFSITVGCGEAGAPSDSASPTPRSGTLAPVAKRSTSASGRKSSAICIDARAMSSVRRPMLPCARQKRRTVSRSRLRRNRSARSYAWNTESACVSQCPCARARRRCVSCTRLCAAAVRLLS